MADTKLSALPALAVEMADTDLVYVDDGGVSKSQAYSVLKAAFATATQGSTADTALQDVVDDTTPTLGGPLDAGGFDIKNGGVVFLTEQAAAEVDVAGKGQLWVKTATPNQLWFTNDEGADVQLGVTAGGSGAFTAGGTTAITPTSAITLNQATGNEIALSLAYTTNKASSGNDTGLLVNQIDTASPGTSLLANLQVGGVSKFSIDNTGKTIFPSGGTGGSPTCSFGSGDVGFYATSSSSIRVSIAGTNVYTWSSSGIQQASGTGFLLSTSVPTATVPSLIPSNQDKDTGIGRSGADQLSLIAGGVEGIRIEEGINGTVGSHVFVPNVTTAPTGNATAGGYLYAEAGALKWRGSSGTVTEIAPA